MTWLQILLLLACPLMMILCMRGMHGGHKHSEDKQMGSSYVSQKDVHQLQIQLADLQEQNAQLTQELHSLRSREEK